MNMLLKWQRLTIFILLILLTSSDQNFTTTTTNEDFRLKSNHPLAQGWSFHFIFGLIGSILNSIVFYNILQERKNIITSVNVLIG